MANTETMTITAALVELKTLQSRITKAINDPEKPIVNLYRPNISKDTIEEMESACQSNYQSVRAFIARRDAIKRAIIQSNAVTTVNSDKLPPKADGTAYTVAEVIELRAHGTMYLEQLVSSMVREASGMMREYEGRRTEIERTAQTIRNTIAGNGSADASINERATDAYQAYISENAPTLVDPNKVIDEIQELRSQIDSIGGETDVILSISNAVTTITVTY